MGCTPTIRHPTQPPEETKQVSDKKDKKNQGGRKSRSIDHTDLPVAPSSPSVQGKPNDAENKKSSIQRRRSGSDYELCDRQHRLYIGNYSVATLIGQSKAIKICALSPDEMKLASACVRDNIIVLWDLLTCKVRCPHCAHRANDRHDVNACMGLRLSACFRC